MLDLDSARRALWKYGSSVPYSTATSTDIGEFDFKLMQVVERFFTLGTWRNMWRRINLAVYDCRITLPRGFDTCRQVASCGGVTPIYSQFHRFTGFGLAVSPLDIGQSGIGPGWFSGLRLVDEAAQTFRIPSGTFTLRAVATEVNADGFTFIGGFDADENELFGEIPLPFVNGAANGTQHYTSLPRIEKAVTTNPVLLYAVDTTTAVATLLGAFAPGETHPAYRQYSVAGLTTEDPDADPAVVSAICKLGFVPAVAANDLIVPGNIGALKLGLQALAFEDKVDPANAGIYWGPNFPDRASGKMSGAIDLLDAELEELQAGETQTFAFSPSFACGEVRNAR
jgi:hypothetical protein